MSKKRIHIYILSFITVIIAIINLTFQSPQVCKVGSYKTTYTTSITTGNIYGGGTINGVKVEWQVSFDKHTAQYSVKAINSTVQLTGDGATGFYKVIDGRTVSISFTDRYYNTTDRFVIKNMFKIVYQTDNTDSPLYGAEFVNGALILIQVIMIIWYVAFISYLIYLKIRKNKQQIIIDN